ncbi:MAG: hypothetical protein PHP92_04235 [Candidatus Nanoarchaeia archaeon]|nr:hypothetical protein [Candidatus Nanoarchaeia archaeon]
MDIKKVANINHQRQLMRRLEKLFKEMERNVNTIASYGIEFKNIKEQYQKNIEKNV